VIGGTKWIDSVFEGFKREQPIIADKMFELYEEAYKRGTEHAAHIASIRHRTLDEQMEKFRAEQVAC
jgi:hypothetical protein